MLTVVPLQEAVQRLFQGSAPPDDLFSQWCDKALKALNTSVDSKFKEQSHFFLKQMSVYINCEYFLTTDHSINILLFFFYT